MIYLHSQESLERNIKENNLNLRSSVGSPDSAPCNVPMINVTASAHAGVYKNSCHL